MVLMNALAQFAGPDPAPTELISITAFGEKHIARFKSKFGDVTFRSRDRLHLGQVEEATLHVRYPKVWNFTHTGLICLFLILGHSTNDISQRVQCRPSPRLWY